MLKLRTNNKNSIFKALKALKQSYTFANVLFFDFIPAFGTCLQCVIRVR